MSKCSYCGSTNYGLGCLYSPTKYHVHKDDTEGCIYCGKKNAYGQACLFSPIPGKYHVYGHGDRCIYCGKKEKGKSCLFAPDGIHRY